MIDLARGPQCHAHGRAEITSETGARPTPRTSSPRGKRGGDVAAWSLAVAACLWIGLCTGIGPLYWAQQGLAQFSWLNAVIMVLAFGVSLGVVVALVRWSRGQRVWPQTWSHARFTRAVGRAALRLVPSRLANSPRFRTAIRRMERWRIVATRHLGYGLVRITDRRWKIGTILCLGWLWVPVTLLSAFGADIRSQIREFSWAYNQWAGMRQPYIGFFSFVPMDIYPTAHYMWPTDPTYLTDQHNIVLTVLYGAVAGVSRYLSGSNDLGIVVLSLGQCLFAAYCCASCTDRFLNLPWRREARTVASVEDPRVERFTPRDPMRPERGMRPHGALSAHEHDTMTAATPAGPIARCIIMLFFLTCPLVLFSTISLTKSPVFAFAFVWWFSLGYELHMTQRPAHGCRSRMRPRTGTIVAMAVSTCVMMISAKYAWYLIVIQVVLLVISDRRRWRTYLVALALPALLIHGAMALLFSSGMVIQGDPIESRGIQLQQIARVAKLNPAGIPDSARELLAPIFNLDQMGDSYFQQDADPVKSSGIQSKKVSYRWRSVSKDDMRDFNRAWWQIVRANPRIATDAFLAKCFGYFDVNDQPYVPMAYYLTNDYVTDWSTWIKYWQPGWRTTVAQRARAVGAIPVLGWIVHGNFYVILTLLLGAAEVIGRRWRILAWHVPLLLLMGVMITSPANNFERHMLPVAFVFGFVALTYWRESQPRTAPSAKLEA
ncbi:DUF6020 family protein [Bifidobacterium mongoliense]|uniref:DUF6020 family protein n=1 Tax=Bifidobacterium mongoliense TaxID=518643 RepID=UPI0026470D85|nr:DUF6020 family protein [Bifidobacterium mongoliense]MDN5979798.1 DUF6020 family protein [Bifidobacterium mongoliense]MDN6783580.1 DUF6020 family protein [Bifidobacterium mongoliense]